MGSEKNLKHSLKNLSKLIKPLMDYFKTLKLKPTAVDPAEFKEYSAKELEWETLTTAERVDNNLQRANLLLRRSDRTNETSITAMEFLRDIDGDLARLRWLAAHLF